MEKTIGNYTIEIEQDTMAESPREWDNLGTMVCFHGGYDLGDKHNYDHQDYLGWDEMEADIVRRENVGVILPLYLYDHSGITIATTPFSCPWDSGQIGFIFVSKEKMREEYGYKRVSQDLKKRVAEFLRLEVETYDKYLTGDVYFYRITNTKTDEQIDSCGGYFGEEDCLSEAEGVVHHYISKEKENGVQLELEFE